MAFALRPTSVSSAEDTVTRGVLAGRKWLLVGFGIFAAIMILMFVTGKTGPGGLPTAVPAGTHVYLVNGYPRANRPLLGWQGWIYLWQGIGFGGGAILLGSFGYKSWKQRSLHNLLGVTFAAGGMFAFDPLYNWLGYFPTNPAFLHIPLGATPWSDLAPTFEPVFFFPLYMVWLMVPALIAHTIWTRLQARGIARRGPAAWMQRHPVISLLIVCKLVCFPLDLGGFRLGCITQAFIFSQAPGPMIGLGQTGQSQLLWEPLLFELPMMMTTMLLYRDRNGMTLHSRLARRLPTFGRLPKFSEVLAGWCIIGLAYSACLGGMAALRFSGSDNHLAKPWPYLDTVVYDPDGLYKANCETAATRPGNGNVNLSRPTAYGACAGPHSK
jgi:Spirocyclase AveC-like